MITSKTYLIAICLIHIMVASCQTSNTTNILAIQGDYSLTKNDLKKHLTQLKSVLGELSKEEIQSEKRILIEMFKEAPEETLASLEGEFLAQPTLSPSPAPVSNTTNLAAGHQKVRTVLGTDIGQMQFNSQAAYQFRVFMANSLLTAGSSSGDSSGGRSADNRTQFCADGTYAEYRSAHLGVSVPGMDAGGYNEDTIRGYWEVASLPNGMMVILLYSTHPLMLEDAPNGLLPFPVGQYDEGFVALPNGDGYRRVVSSCGY